jgi:hypothetical protein
MIKVNEIEILKMLEEQEYGQLAQYMKDRILEQNTSPTEIRRKKAFAKLSKSVQKMYKDRKPAIAGAYELNDKLMLTDGFRGFVMNWKSNEIPELAKVEYDGELCKLDQLYKETDRTEIVKIDTDKLKVQLAEYKTKLKMVKPERGITKENRGKGIKERYFAVESKSGFISHFNIEFIQEAHDIMDLNSSEITLGKEWVQALQIENEFGKCLVLPVRLSGDIDG